MSFLIKRNNCFYEVSTMNVVIIPTTKKYAKYKSLFFKCSFEINTRVPQVLKNTAFRNQLLAVKLPNPKRHLNNYV